eukprot:scaffold119604_cov65-Phaeocystis_antarctica.AAC.3
MAHQPSSPMLLLLRLISVSEPSTVWRSSERTSAPGKPMPLLSRSRVVSLSTRSFLRGMWQKMLRVCLPRTAAASCCAPSPVMLLLQTSNDGLRDRHAALWAELVAPKFDTHQRAADSHVGCQGLGDGWVDALTFEVPPGNRVVLVVAQRVEDGAPAHVAQCVAREVTLRQRAIEEQRLADRLPAFWANFVSQQVQIRQSWEEYADGPHPDRRRAPDSTRQSLAKAFTHALANCQRIVPPCRPLPQQPLGETLVPRASLAQCTRRKVFLEGKVRRLKSQWLRGQQADQRQLVSRRSAAELVQDLL